METIRSKDIYQTKNFKQLNIYTPISQFQYIISPSRGDILYPFVIFHFQSSVESKPISMSSEILHWLHL